MCDIDEATIVNRFEFCRVRAKALGITISTTGSRFQISGYKKNFGCLATINEVLAFLYGYEYSVKSGKKKG